LIRRVFESVSSEYADPEIGVHLHSAPGEAAAKVLAAYDAGCRRFDSTVGGLGGCPFAQDALIGNIPTESVIAALQQRGIDPPIREVLKDVAASNSQIATSYSQVQLVTCIVSTFRRRSGSALHSHCAAPKHITRAIFCDGRQGRRLSCSMAGVA